MSMVTLKEYCSSVRDGTHDSPKQCECGKYLITSKHINQNTIDLASAYKISEDDFNKVNKRSRVEKWDVLMTMIGSVGRLYVVREDPDYAIKNLALFKIGNEKRAKYLYYYLSNKEVQDYFEAVANGTSQHFVGLGYLRKFKIKDFDQNSERIVDILDKYDGLIENNNRRIKILEEMAENLYKEWFVRFRFPGYENAEFENGIPKGWEEKGLLDVSDILYGYPFNSSLFKDEVDNVAVVRIRDILDKKTETYTSELCDEKYRLCQNDVLIGMDGIFHMCIWCGRDGYLNQRVVRIRSSNKDINNYFLYLAMYPKIKELEKSIVGTTVAHLGDKHLKKMKLLIPTEDVLRKINVIIKNILKELNGLQLMNDNLEKQRDALLPKLMSGKLEI